uniref:Uncharacterized protein n=1 Tax=Panagrolaimus sp. PS1159 TaxID=55785 RepID=A0AC35FP79_9BILA
MKTFQAVLLVALLIIAFSSLPESQAQYYYAATWPYYYYPYTYGYGAYGLYGKREAGFEPQQQQFHPRSFGQHQQ